MLNTKKKLNILMVAACAFPARQGSQVLIRQLAEILSSRGYNIHLVTYHFGEDGQNLPFQIHRIPNYTGIFSFSSFRSGPDIRKPFLDFLLLQKIFGILKETPIPFDIMHVHNYEGLLLGILAKRGKFFWRNSHQNKHQKHLPLIYHTHNALYDELHTYFENPWTKRVAHYTANWLDSFLPKQADHCIAINPELKDFLIQKGVECSKISIIPPGIIPQEFKDISCLNDKNSKMQIIYTGNLDGYQNIEILFKVLLKVRESLPEAKLIIVSPYQVERNYSQKQKILQLSKKWQEYSFLNQNGAVKFVCTPSFEETKKWLQASAVAVSPRQTWSGFPIKILNYMAMGKPIVAFRSSVVKGLKHLESGYIVEDGDIDGFAEGISKILTNPKLAEYLGGNAQKVAQDLYLWDYMADQIEEIYHKILETS